MSPTIHHRYNYFHSTVQRAKDRRQKFHFCRLPFDVTSSLISLLSEILKILCIWGSEPALNEKVTPNKVFFNAYINITLSLATHRSFRP